MYSVVKEPEFAISARDNRPTFKDDQRKPASIQMKTGETEVTRRNAIQSKSIVLDYECSSENKTVEVEASLLRLRGTDCLDEKWEDVSVVNHSNGFTGSIIFLNDKKFTTDFIDLNEGENQLSIQAKNEKGQVISQKLTIQRRIPAVAN